MNVLAGLGISRSVSSALGPINAQVSKQLLEIAEKKPRYRSPRLHVMLRRQRRKRRFRSEALGPLLPPTHRNQYWAMELVSEKLTNGLRFRSVTLVDVLTKECTDIEVAKSLAGQRVVQVPDRPATELFVKLEYEENSAC